MTFQEFGLHESLTRVLPEIGFERPTPVQAHAIPAAMSGRDLLASAQTGTGKTAAFLLPIFHRLLTEPGKGLQVLVLEPTRELALQVEEQAKLFSKYTPLRAACVYGGVGFGPQEKAFQDGVEVISATPGRLLDHTRQGNVRFDSLRVLVLDEVDRMLDMGFLPDVRSILRALPERRQTLFFSATVPGEIQHLCDSMLKDPERIAITPERKTAEGITQTVYPVPEHLKAKLLNLLLEQEHVTSALVFTRTKQGADKVCAVVERRGLPVRRIHGDLSQSQRLKALADFKEGVAKFLVATDIAARGLDVEGISHVINYDVPESPDDYVHRVGRTARAEATGHAYSLVSPRDAGPLAAIEKHLGHKLEKIIMQSFDYEESLGPQHEVRQGHDGISDFDDLGSGRGPVAPPPFRDADERATVLVRYGQAVEGEAYEEAAPGGMAAGRRGRNRGRGRDRGRDRGPAAGSGQAHRERGPSAGPGQGMGGRERGREGERRERSERRDAGPGMPPRLSRQEEAERRQATQAMSATEVLRRAGSQRAVIESDVMDLRPRQAEPEEAAEAAPAQAGEAPFDQERPRQGGGNGNGGNGGGAGGGRRRRRRRGRGGERPEGGYSQGAGQGRPQGERGLRDERPRGGERGPRDERQRRERHDSQPAAPAGGGLWQKLKGVLGLGGGRKDSGKW